MTNFINSSAFAFRMRTFLPLPTDIANYVNAKTPQAVGVWNYFNDIRQIPRLSKKRAR